MPKFINETGNIYGQLTVLYYTGNGNWHCKCSCSNLLTVNGKSLRNGDVSRCKQCANKLKRDSQITIAGKHPIEYAVYHTMHARCKNHPRYENIRVCDRWSGKDGFENFLKDMGPRPIVKGKRYTLDRIDVNGPYSPENCRWADDRTQAVNRRSTIFVEIDGQCNYASHWNDLAKLKKGTFIDRLKRGWSPKSAITTPQYTKYHQIHTTLDYVLLNTLPKDVKIGQKFGDLTVVSAIEPLECGHPRVLCKCKCSNIITVHENTLLKNCAISCGCHTLTHYKNKNKKITFEQQLLNKARTVFNNLRSICTNPKSPRFSSKRTFEFTDFNHFLATIGIPQDLNDVIQCDDQLLFNESTVRWSSGNSKKIKRSKHSWNFKDLTNQKFGMLTVKRLSNIRKNNHTCWECECDCGNTVIVTSQDLINKRTTSCGCKHENLHKNAKGNIIISGLTRQQWRRRYDSMHRRCEDPKSNRYYCYGARGIKVCDRWSGKDGFENFLNDMAYFWPGKGHTLDRIDINGPYSPENCRWADLKTQANNNSNTHYITYNGETHSLTEWERIKGFTRGLISYRINKCKWTIEKALTTSPRKRKAKT